MPLKQYYLLALWMPLILPTAILIFGKHDNLISGLLLFSIAFGGIQYFIFTIWALYYNHKKNTEEIKKFLYKAPLYFMPFCIIGLTIIFIIIEILGKHPIHVAYLKGASYLGSSTTISLFVIPIGYFYVITTLVLGFILKKIKVIKK